MKHLELDDQLEEALRLTINQTNRPELRERVIRDLKYSSSLIEKAREISGVDFVEQELRDKERQIMERISLMRPKWNEYRRFREASQGTNLKRIDLMEKNISTRLDSIIKVEKAFHALRELDLKSYNVMFSNIQKPLRNYYLWKRISSWIPRLSYLLIVLLVFVIGITIVGFLVSPGVGLVLAIGAWAVQEFLFVPYVQRWLKWVREENLTKAIAQIFFIDNSQYLIEVTLDKDIEDLQCNS